MNPYYIGIGAAASAPIGNTNRGIAMTAESGTTITDGENTSELSSNVTVPP